MENKDKKSSEARLRANKKYDDKSYDRVNLRMRKEDYEAFETFITDNNLTKNGFINKAIKYCMEHYDDMTDDTK
jgi:hypothetical protein